MFLCDRWSCCVLSWGYSFCVVVAVVVVASSSLLLSSSSVAGFVVVLGVGRVEGVLRACLMDVDLALFCCVTCCFEAFLLLKNVFASSTHCPVSEPQPCAVLCSECMSTSVLGVKWHCDHALRSCRLALRSWLAFAVSHCSSEYTCCTCSSPYPVCGK